MRHQDIPYTRCSTQDAAPYANLGYRLVSSSPFKANRTLDLGLHFPRVIGLALVTVTIGYDKNLNSYNLKPRGRVLFMAFA